MPHAEHTVAIDSPAQEIFDYLADGTHNRDWRSGVLDIERTQLARGKAPPTARYSRDPAADA